MAGKKDNYLSFVIGNLTDAQAANIMSDVAKSKNKHAPSTRSVGAITKQDGVGSILAKGWQNLIGKNE